MAQHVVFIFVGIIIMLAALEWFMPAIFRPTNLFGVTVAPDATRQPAGRAVIRRWRVGVATLGLVGLALTLVLLLAPPLVAVLAQSGVLLVVALGQVALYIAANHQAQALAVPTSGGVREASLAVRPRTTLVPIWWEALPLALIGLTAFILTQQYATAPHIIPVHWNINNQVDRTAVKSVGTFFFMVWMQLALYVLLTVITATVGLARIGNNASPGSQSYRVAMARFLFFIKCMVIILLGTLGAITANYSATNTAPDTLLFVTPLLFVVAVLGAGAFIFFRYGQSGWRIDAARGTLPATDNMPDRAWKGGVIYYNPSDPALFVERRDGMGFTFNFGHRGSWLVLGGFLLLVAAAVGVPILLGASAR